MKQCVRLTIALALLGGSSGLEARTSSTFARAWLASHAAPNIDELAELKDANPEAYAIVKALLAKRSLGLLDPKHPTASFSGPAPSADDAPHGAAAYADLVTPDELASHGRGASLKAETSAQELYPEAPAPQAHHDWLNWKPQDSAVSDEQMVQNVLGAVAELKGGKHKAAAQSSSALDDDAASLGLNAPASTTNAPKALSSSQENSYLRGLNLDSSMPAVAAPSVAPAQVNYLASFSWSDDAKPGPQQQKKSASPQTERKPKVSTLSSWLGVSDDSQAPAAQSQKVVSQAPDVNPYLAALQ